MFRLCIYFILHCCEGRGLERSQTTAWKVSCRGCDSNILYKRPLLPNHGQPSLKWFIMSWFGKPPEEYLYFPSGLRLTLLMIHYKVKYIRHWRHQAWPLAGSQKGGPLIYISGICWGIAFINNLLLMCNGPLWNFDSRYYFHFNFF